MTAFARRAGMGFPLAASPPLVSAAIRFTATSAPPQHGLDWGTAGLFDTLDTLDRLGIAGAGRDAAEVIRPALIDLGDRGRVAVFSVGCADAGVPPWWAAAESRPGVHAMTELDDDATRKLRRAIEPWRDARTVIVLSIHWGPTGASRSRTSTAGSRTG